MTRHYPLHGENLWAAAAFQRRSVQQSAAGEDSRLHSLLVSLSSCFGQDGGPAEDEAVQAGDSAGEESFVYALVDSLRRRIGLDALIDANTICALQALLSQESVGTVPELEDSSVSDLIERSRRSPASEGTHASNVPPGEGSSIPGRSGPAESFLSRAHSSVGMRILAKLVKHAASWTYLPLAWPRRVAERFWDRLLSSRYRQVLSRRLERATSYLEWRSVARKLDDLDGATTWRVQDVQNDGEDGALSAVCNLRGLERKLIELNKLYQAGKIKNLAFALREHMVRSTAGLAHPELHAHSRVGTKRTVEDFVGVISFFLFHIAHAEEPRVAEGSASAGPSTKDAPRTENRTIDGLTTQDKLKFFNESRHAHGRTALLLSGGAAMGLNHLGVVKALLNLNLLPKVVSGTSAGALVASIVGIFNDTDLRGILEAEDLMNPLTKQPFTFRFFDESLSIWRKLRRLARKGAFQDIRMLQDCLRRNYGDMTFGEAYLRTKRILNITVCPAREAGPPVLLNYLTAPQVLIWSAASASCALPLVFAPVGLVAKDSAGRLVPYQPDGARWIDGSVSSDVPLARIGELFNVNHFIVSQTNPHIIPRQFPLFQTRLAMLIKSEFQFRYWQALQLKLIPRIVSHLFPHMLQPYEGDVTIMPEVTMTDISRLFRNPPTETVLYFLRRGELQTFPKLDRVRLHCLIERSLEACVDHVAGRKPLEERQNSGSAKASAASADEPSGSARSGSPSFGRVPSWLWVDPPQVHVRSSAEAPLAVSEDAEAGSDSGDSNDQEIVKETERAMRCTYGAEL